MRNKISRYLPEGIRRFARVSTIKSRGLGKFQRSHGRALSIKDRDALARYEIIVTMNFARDTLVYLTPLTSGKKNGKRDVRNYRQFKR